MVQPMGCEHSDVEPSDIEPSDIERTLDLPASGTDEVWDELVEGGWLGADAEIDARPGGAVRVGDKVGVVEEVERPRRLSFWWTETEGDDPPSRVDLDLLPLGVGTRLRVRETRLDLDSRFMLRTRALARA